MRRHAWEKARGRRWEAYIKGDIRREKVRRPVSREKADGRR